MSSEQRPQDRVFHDTVERERAKEERDAALNVAADEYVNRRLAEAQAVDARITANQAQAHAEELRAEHSLIRNELVQEREAASNNAFGFYLVTGILLAILLVGGIYFYTQQNDSNKTAAAPVVVTSPTVTRVVTPAPAPTATQAPIIINAPKPVVAPAPRVNIKMTPPAQTAPAPASPSEDRPTDTDKSNDTDKDRPDTGSGKSNGDSGQDGGSSPN